MPLTDAKMFRLQAAQADASKATHKPRKVTDSDGLYILLQPTGSMLWRFAYRFDEKQKVLALGQYPDLSLRQARKAADDARPAARSTPYRPSLNWWCAPERR